MNGYRSGSQNWNQYTKNIIFLCSRRPGVLVPRETEIVLKVVCIPGPFTLSNSEFHQLSLIYPGGGDLLGMAS